MAGEAVIGRRPAGLDVAPDEPLVIPEIDRPVILVTGSRFWRDGHVMGIRLDLAGEFLGGDVCLMHGKQGKPRDGMKPPLGADVAAREHAARRGWPVLDRPADWDGPCDDRCHHGPRMTYGWGPKEGQSWCPAKGPQRSARMVEEVVNSTMPAVVVAFFMPGEKNIGTRRCADLARKSGLRVLTVGQG